MQLLIAFMFGAVLLSAWELRGGPRWRTPVVLVACTMVAGAFWLQRVVAG
jgi:hypothetical protein